MTAGEVVARARRTAAHRWDAALYGSSRRRGRRAWTPRAGDVALERAPDAPLGFISAERARFVAEQAPEATARLVQAAADVLDARYCYFGYPPVRLAEPVDFARDPFSERVWPARHGKRIDYRLAGFGDPKWIWELNRLQELPLLAAASLVSGEERYARRGLDLARRWLATTEPGRGIAWSNGFEAGMRAISLALFLDALRGSPLLEPRDDEQIAVSLWQHARWIRRDPSTHSSANNHLIGELSGLVAIGLLAPELRDAELLLADSLAGLAREADRQIARDGTSVEQAFRYHLFVLDHLLVVVALLDAAGRSCPAAVIDALRRSGRALAAQLGESEPEPTYGDGDDGLVIRLGGREPRTARAVAAGIAARLGDGAARAAATPDATTYWLFGADGANRLALTEAAPVLGSVFLQDAGVAILRAGRRRVMFDAGPLGYLAIAAHGHADALQVTVSEGEDDLVVDPGVGSYFGRPPVRAALRGTAAHASVTVDGADQSEPGGPFLWARHASARVLGLDLDGGVVAAEHDGYRSLPDPVTHRRLVRVAAEGPILVVDQLVAEASHTVTQSWPLHPSLDAVVQDDVVRASVGGIPRLLIAVDATVPGRLELHRGEEAPVRGWYSRGLEHVEPAWLATWSTTASGAFEIVTLLWPVSRDAWPEPALELRSTADVIEIGLSDSSGHRVCRTISKPSLALMSKPMGSQQSS